MGQVPKKIIHAQTGAQLSFRLNGAEKKLSEEAVDAAADEVANKYIEAGELRPSDKTAFMNAYATFKNNAKSGQYDLDTAGKEGIVSAGYFGDDKGYGTQTKGGETVASERGAFGSRFTKKPRKGNQSDLEAMVLRGLFPKIGGLASEQDLATKTQADKDALKLKTDQETAEATEKAKWAHTPNPSKYIGDKYFGGSQNFSKAFGKMSAEEKEAMLQDYSKGVVDNWLKYEPLKNSDVSWMGKHKDATGNVTYNQAFYQDLFPRLFGDEGSAFINNVYGIVEPGAPGSPEQIAKDKESETASWNTLKTRNDATVIDENTIEAPPSEDIKIGNRTFALHHIRDPKTGIVTQRRVEYPVGQRHGLAGEMPKGDVIPQLVQNTLFPQRAKQIAQDFRFYRQAPKYNQPTSTFNMEGNYLKDVSNPQNILTYLPLPSQHDGGVISLQTGGTLQERSKMSSWLAKPDMDKKINNTSYIGTTYPEPASVKATETAKGTKVQDVEKEKHTSTDTTPKISEMKFNTADSLEAGAMLADLTALGASFVPGGNFVAGGAGLAGTAASMGAEYARGELGTEDIGKYALSTGLDLVGFVPGVGLGTMTAKLATKAPRMVNLLSKTIELGLAGYGVVTGLDELNTIKDKISQDGFKSLTAQDVKTLAQSMQAIVNAKHISSSKKSMKMGESAGDARGEIMGKVQNNVTKEVVPTKLVKEGDAWVPVDKTLRTKDHVVVKEGPLFGEKHVVGSQQVMPTPVKEGRIKVGKDTKYNPETGEEYSFFQRVNMPKPFTRLNNKYAEMANKKFGNKVPAPVAPEVPATPAVPVKAPMALPEKSVSTGVAEKAQAKQARLAELKAKKAPRAEREAKVEDYLVTRQVRNKEEFKNAPEYPLLRSEKGKNLSKAASKLKRQQDLHASTKAQRASAKTIEEGAKTGYPLLRDETTKKPLKLAESKRKYQSMKKPSLRRGGKIPMGYDGWAAKLIGQGKEFPVTQNTPSLVDTFKSSFGGTPFGEEDFKGAPNQIKFEDTRNLSPSPAVGVMPTNKFNLNPPKDVSVPSSVSQGITYKAGTDLFTPKPVTAQTLGNAKGSTVFKPTDFSAGTDNAFLKGLNANAAVNKGIGFQSQYGPKTDFASKPLAGAKNPTLFEGMPGLSQKNLLNLSEFGRVAMMNRTLGQRQHKLYNPAVVTPAENAWSVAGDELTRSAFQGQANRLRQQGRANLTSDATRNIAQNLAYGEKADQLEAQGNVGFAQGLEKNKEMAFKLKDQSDRERATAANQRALYTTKAEAARDADVRDTKEQIASNWNTWLASQNMKKSQEATEKEGRRKAFDLEGMQAGIDEKYQDVLYPTGGRNTPEYQKRLKEYGKARSDAERRIYFNKAGGVSEEYKRRKELRKEEIATNKENTKIANTWSSKITERQYKAMVGSSKELRDLITKIFSK